VTRLFFNNTRARRVEHFSIPSKEVESLEVVKPQL